MYIKVEPKNINYKLRTMKTIKLKKRKTRKAFNAQHSAFSIQSGITLIELLAVISIMILLSGTFFLNYRKQQNQLALQRSVNKVAQDISKAKYLAINTREFEGQIPPGGYGVYIGISTLCRLPSEYFVAGFGFGFGSPVCNTYLIYADNNGNKEYDEFFDSVIDCDLEKDTKICDLEEDIFIKDISPSPLSINFKAPDPEVKISENATSATIILAIKSDPNNTKTITINKLGLITIE